MSSEDRYGRETHDSGKRMLVVEIPVTLIDETWSDRDLVLNAAMHLDSMISQGARHVRSVQGRVTEADEPYRMEDDVQVWASRKDYFDDIMEGHA